MSRLTYTIFLAIFSANEISTILSINKNPYLQLLAVLFFFYTLLNLFIGDLPGWVWRNGFSVIGISALLYLITTSLGAPEDRMEIIDACISLYVWIRSIIYLNSYNEKIAK